MNVCIICQADGVAEVLSNWYCVDHIEQGFVDLGMFLARARGWDDGETADALWDWLES